MSGWWDQILATVSTELSSSIDPEATARVLLRLGVAAALGGLLGWERERAGKSAGLRTHMLVSMGAAMFVLGAAQAGIAPEDNSRVIQGIVQGIGFLGAGTILKRDKAEVVEGLTTAAGIWFTAAIGTAAGLGLEGMAVLSCLLGLVVLWGIPLAQQTVAGQPAQPGEPPASPPSGEKP